MLNTIPLPSSLTSYNIHFLPPPHPLTYATLAFTTLILTLGFAPSSSIIRPALLPFFGLLVFLGLQTCAAVNPALASMLTAITAGLTLKYLDVGVLSAWEFEAGGPTSELGGLKPVASSWAAGRERQKAVTAPTAAAAEKEKEKGKGKEDSGILARLQFGLSMATNQRLIDTPWEVKNVPPFPSPPPTKLTFLLRTTLRLLLYIILLDAASFAPHLPSPSSPTYYFHAHNQPFLSRLNKISTAELSTRASASIAHWTMGYAAIQAVYSLLSLITVGSGLTVHTSWRPLFGSLSQQTTSVRAFWGSFWHQILRQTLSAPATFVAHTVLKLKRGSSIRKYTALFVTFFVSGIYHLAMDAAFFGVLEGCRESGALGFFVWQACAITFEDSVQALWGAAVTGKTINSLTRAVEIVVGHAWTCAWIVISTPQLSYPMLRKTAELAGPGGNPAAILPFSPIGFIFSGISEAK